MKIFRKSPLSDGDHDRKLGKAHKIAVMGKLDKFFIRSIPEMEMTTRKNTIMMYGTDDRKRFNNIQDSRIKLALFWCQRYIGDITMVTV